MNVRRETAIASSLEPVSGSNMAGDTVQVNVGGAVVAAR
jgi:hypothetical protein